MRRFARMAAVLSGVWALLSGLPAGAEVDESAIRCIACHVEQGVKPQLIDEWRNSIHYRHDVTCGDCHGFSETDVAAMPDPGKGAHTKPDNGTVVVLCAQCHQDWIEYYPQSAHFREERQSCLMCHATGGNSHGIQAASLAIINPERCTECHSFERAREAKQSLAEAELAIAHLDGMLEELHASGERPPHLETLISTAHELQTRAHLELHTFRLSRIREITARITQLNSSLNEEEQRQLKAYIEHAPPEALIDEGDILCIECHADISDEHVALIDDWRGSIHYRNGVTCGRCHGFTETDFDAMPDPGDPPHTKPEAGAVVSMCGQCHGKLVDYYPLSAHFRKEQQSCTMCHAGGGDSHNIQPASLGIIQRDRCSECHTYDWAAQAKDAFLTTETADQALDASLSAIAEQGYHSTRLEGLHEAAHALQERVPLELHTFQLKRIKEIASSITELQKHAEAEEQRILAKLALQGRRQRVGALIMVSCFVFSGLIMAFRKTYIDEWRARYGIPDR